MIIVIKKLNNLANIAKCVPIDNFKSLISIIKSVTKDEWEFVYVYIYILYKNE